MYTKYLKNNKKRVNLDIEIYVIKKRGDYYVYFHYFFVFINGVSRL